MRILHIIPSLRKGGAERICMDICEELARQGNSVKLVYLNNVVEYNAGATEYELHFVPSTVHLSLTKTAQYNIKQLEELIHSFQPDIIHTHLFEAEIGSRSITYPRAKWFSHCHDNMRQFETFSLGTLTNKQKLTEYYERHYLLNRYRINGGNRFVAISNNAKEYFERVLPADLRDVTLLSNAINTSNFKRPSNYSTQTGTGINLVTVGSLVNKKNQTFLIDVVQLLKQKGRKVHLHVLGDGPNRTMLQQKATELGLDKEITLHGNVADVQEFLWNANIYVHSATYEPFGLVLVEAMAAGLPVVSIDGKGNRDIIRNGENGFILSTNSAEEFAEKIMLLMDDKNLYEQFRVQGLQTAQQYDIVEYTRKLSGLYQQALNL